MTQKATRGAGQRGAAYHLLERLGGIRAVANYCRVPYARVLKWSTIGVPHRYWHPLQSMAKARGVELSTRSLQRAWNKGRERLQNGGRS